MRLEVSELKKMSMDVRVCKQCGRRLPERYKDDICEICKESNLFQEVKDFIRANDVRENDVAEHFGIPVRKVREWIRDGRIQYKDVGEKVSGMFCQVCGKPLEFGTICRQCLKQQKIHGVAKGGENVENARMRFMDKDMPNK